MRFCNLVLQIAYDSLKEFIYFHDANVILPYFLNYLESLALTMMLHNSELVFVYYGGNIKFFDSIY